MLQAYGLVCRASPSAISRCAKPFNSRIAAQGPLSRIATSNISISSSQSKYQFCVPRRAFAKEGKDAKGDKAAKGDQPAGKRKKETDVERRTREQAEAGKSLIF